MFSPRLSLSQVTPHDINQKLEATSRRAGLQVSARDAEAVQKRGHEALMPGAGLSGTSVEHEQSENQTLLALFCTYRDNG